MGRSILLASFVDKSKLYEALDKISNTLKIEKDSIFIFINEEEGNEYILTYNLNSESANIQFTKIWENTISVHRKKHTNTLYSINAMNELIKSKNNGKLNQEFKITWEDYENCFLIIKNGKLKMVPIRLIKINQ